MLFDLNGVHIGALDSPIRANCVEFRSGPNGTSPGAQNPQTNNLKHVKSILNLRWVPPSFLTKMIVNWVATARHGLILCQHGAVASTDLLEALLG